MSRGRPRAFDPDLALERAVTVFWRDGFEGASVSDLCDAMGVSKPSLYATFGDKEELYLMALDRYATAWGGRHKTVLESEPRAFEAVRQFLYSIVSLYVDPAFPGGCLVVAGACASPSKAVPPAVREALAKTMKGGQEALERRLARAQAEGELAADVDVPGLATYFNTVAAGLGVQSRVGAGRDSALEFRRVADDAMRAWPALAPGMTRATAIS